MCNARLLTVSHVSGSGGGVEYSPFFGGTDPKGVGTPSPHEQTHTCENITFPQLRLQALIYI